MTVEMLVENLDNMMISVQDAIQIGLNIAVNVDQCKVIAGDKMGVPPLEQNILAWGNINVYKAHLMIYNQTNNELIRLQSMKRAVVPDLMGKE